MKSRLFIITFIIGLFIAGYFTTTYSAKTETPFAQVYITGGTFGERVTDSHTFTSADIITLGGGSYGYVYVIAETNGCQWLARVRHNGNLVFDNNFSSSSQLKTIRVEAGDVVSIEVSNTSNCSSNYWAKVYVTGEPQ